MIILVVIAGCGGAGDEGTNGDSQGATVARKHPGEKRNAWISLDDHEGAQSVGILVAEERGYFEELGIEMTITTAALPDGPIRYVSENFVDFGVVRQPQLILARDKEGLPITAIATLVPRPTVALISLKKSKIGAVADLKGKTVAVTGLPFQEALLWSLLAKSGLSRDEVKVKRVGYELADALLGGRADATFGGSWNIEGVALAARGSAPVVLRPKSLGVPPYEEQVLVARNDQLSEDPQLVRDVLAAIAHGTATAIEHPGAAVQAVEKASEADPNATPQTIQAEVKATLPLLSETGYMDRDEANDLVAWMQEEGWIRSGRPGADLLTNDYLSPEP